MPKNTTNKEHRKKSQLNEPSLLQKSSPMDTFNRALKKIVSAPKKAIKKK